MTALETYIEGLRIGQGRHAGEQFALLPWERRFLTHAFRQPGDAALSIARGNGKSTFLAAIAAATVDADGPLVSLMAECLLVASSFEQGLINFRHLKHFLQPTFERYGVGVSGRYRIQDTTNRASIRDTITGALIRVVGSDPRRLHGAAPKILILDEVAQWPHTQVDSMLAALTTSRGKITDSRAIWIGTRPKSESHPFARMLAGNAAYSQVHAATEKDNPFHVKTWRKANPSLDHMPDLLATIRQEAELAKKDPSMLAAFKALRLNMGVSDVVENLLLDSGAWEAREGDAPRAGEYVLGVDLGGAAAMTAAAAYWPDTGRLEAFAAFPKEPSLDVRGLRDGVSNAYVQMFKRGELIQVGTHTVDLRAFLDEILERWGKPRAIVADRYAEDRLREVLAGAGFPFTGLILRGQGFRDGAEDVDRFRRHLLKGKVTPHKSLLLRSAMSEARTIADPAGNEKLAKSGEGKRIRGRDDAVAASILAVAEGSKWNKRKPTEGPQIRIVRAV